MKYIPLTKGKRAIVDDADYDAWSSVPWFAHVCKSQSTPGAKVRFYACRSLNPGMDRMHRKVLGAPNPGVRVDHINGNTLDNRRKNLRFATNQQNQFNRGPNRNNKLGIKGVCRCKHIPHMFRAKINGSYLGIFPTAAAARRAYLKAAKELHGQFVWKPSQRKAA